MRESKAMATASVTDPHGRPDAACDAGPPSPAQQRCATRTQAAWAKALFVSTLQRSDAPDGAALAAAIDATVRRYGVRGCAARMAKEFGDHPETAAQRMRWAVSAVAEAFGRTNDGTAARAAVRSRPRRRGVAC